AQRPAPGTGARQPDGGDKPGKQGDADKGDERSHLRSCHGDSDNIAINVVSVNHIADTGGMIQSDAYHPGDLRAAIIATAITMAAEQGVAALSIRAIARRLGVSHAAPARHFANRSALLAGVAAAAFSLFSDELEKSARGATEEARLSALGVAYVRFAL